MSWTYTRTERHWHACPNNAAIRVPPTTIEPQLYDKFMVDVNRADQGRLDMDTTALQIPITDVSQTHGKDRVFFTINNEGRGFLPNGEKHSQRNTIITRSDLYLVFYNQTNLDIYYNDDDRNQINFAGTFVRDHFGSPRSVNVANLTLFSGNAIVDQVSVNVEYDALSSKWRPSYMLVDFEPVASAHDPWSDVRDVEVIITNWSINASTNPFSLTSLGMWPQTSESEEITLHQLTGRNAKDYVGTSASDVDLILGTVITSPRQKGSRDEVEITFPDRFLRFVDVEEEETETSSGNRCQDVNGDRYVNKLDLKAVAQAFGTTSIEIEYNLKADINNDNKVDVDDIVLVSKALGKLNIELPECGGTQRGKLCPDLNGNGEVDSDDVTVYTEFHGAVAGDEEYFSLVDYVEDQKIDIQDVVTVSRLVGKDASEFGACEDRGALEKEFEETERSRRPADVIKCASTGFTCSDVRVTSDGKVQASVRFPTDINLAAYDLAVNGDAGCGIQQIDEVANSGKHVTIECDGLNLLYTKPGNRVSGTIHLYQNVNGRLTEFGTGSYSTAVESPGNVVVEDVPALRKGLTTAAEAPRRGFFGRLAKSLGLVIFDA